VWRRRWRRRVDATRVEPGRKFRRQSSAEHRAIRRTERSAHRRADECADARANAGSDAAAVAIADAYPGATADDAKHYHAARYNRPV
jgi:hypothetical protein